MVDVVLFLVSFLFMYNIFMLSKILKKVESLDCKNIEKSLDAESVEDSWEKLKKAFKR